MEDDSQFSQLLEKYSEYLSDATNRNDLLALGRRIFSASSTESENRASIKLLKSKEIELSQQPEKTVNRSASRKLSIRSILTTQHMQTLTQEQINEEIRSCQEKINSLHEQKKVLTEKHEELVNYYNNLIMQGVSEKEKMRNEIKELKNELKDALTKMRSPAQQNFPALNDAPPSILPVLTELAELNQQILSKVLGFKQAAKDAMAHCERAALNKYKPQMEKLMAEIYQNAEQLPIKDLIGRFNSSAENVEVEVKKLESELQSEYTRNEELLKQSKHLDEDLNTQKDEVSRMRKQQSLLSQDITKLNEIAIQRISSLKSEYASMLANDDPVDIEPLSARAVVIHQKVQNKEKKVPPNPVRTLKRMASKVKVPVTHETKIPDIPSVDEYIEMEKQELLKLITRIRI